jgi:ankyrin repeat protein
MFASYKGHVDIVRLLVDKGADTTLRNISRKTALDMAKTPEIAALLKDAPELQRRALILKRQQALKEKSRRFKGPQP